MIVKEEELRYRMYGFVPYNLSDIQKGIQFGHAVQEYNNLMEYKNTIFGNQDFKKWKVEDKTFIILNGGSTNKNEDNLGTLNQYFNLLFDKGITMAYFEEPDLGDQLTAFVFLVDERVWDKEKYPDYEEYFNTSLNYMKWKERIGGDINEFLREFLKDKKLA